MTERRTFLSRARLSAGIAPAAMLLAMTATPAFAQQAAPAPQAEPAGEDQSTEVVVTGTLLRAPVTASPVSVLGTAQIEQRGINTIQEAIQQIPSNSGPALTNSFTANGAFAGGASAVSLRGLSTNSTLVLFDGLRAAYYPLADDGSRNFVDLNTIPDDIIEKIETLRDGASSTYGADAIAGVVNIITKKQFKGVSGRLEGGVSEFGDGDQYRVSLTAGVGDLAEKGYNAYISGFYYRSNGVRNADRPYPFNTDDQRGISFGGNSGPNNILNGLDGTNSFPDANFAQTGASLYLRPYDGTNTTPQGRFQLVGNCYRGTAYNLTAAELALPGNASAPTTVCQEDFTLNYGNITATQERYGFSGRFTADVGGGHEAYAEFNFIQSISEYSGLPATIRANAPAGIVNLRYSTSTAAGAVAPGSGPLTLPVFVCPERVNCATSAQRRLNPNNPFAAAGQVARVLGRLQDIQEFNSQSNRAFRGAIGLRGELLKGWDYTLEATGMRNDLLSRREGYVYIQHLLDVIADGTYNFVNPSQNTQAVRDYLAPRSDNISSSDLYQVQGTLAGELFQLPGGPLAVGVGASYRYEAVNNPSGNPDFNGPTQRYFRLNAFGAIGSRSVVSGFGELRAPILDQLEVTASGRYDTYSSGQSNFSPKVGVLVTPIRQVKLRGTWSRGFRIPAFAEANALPTTGFVTNSSGTFPNAYLQTYGCTQATFASCPTYIRSSSYGLTTLGSPDLRPEKSRSFTAGILVEPVRNWTFSVDYYNIRKTDAITFADSSVALAAYYNNQPIPAGYTVIADAPDVNNPTLQPRVAFVQSGFVNANSQNSSGLDFDLSGRISMFGITWNTNVNASYILELSTTFPGGRVEQYAGTLGNFNLTSGNGTSRLRGYWSNNFVFDKTFSLTATANYYGGYNLSAEDQGVASGSGGLNPGYVPNDVPAYVTLDLVGNVKVNDKFNFYLNILNVLGDLPPIDPVTYGAHLYNSVQGGTGIIGRYFRAGVKVGF